jgi:hypothetical protein
VEFFHFQDLVTPEGKIDFFLEEDENFKRPGVPTTKDEYIRVREASLKFITLRATGWQTGSRRTTPTLRSDGNSPVSHFRAHLRAPPRMHTAEVRLT